MSLFSPGEPFRDRWSQRTLFRDQANTRNQNGSCPVNPATLQVSLVPYTQIHTSIQHTKNNENAHTAQATIGVASCQRVSRGWCLKSTSTRTLRHTTGNTTDACSWITRVELFDANEKPKPLHQQYSLIHTHRRRLLMTGKTRARCKRDKHKHTQKHECIQPRTNVQRSTC